MATWLFVQHIMQTSTNEISFCDGIPPVSEGLNCGNRPHVMTSSYNDNVYIHPWSINTLRPRQNGRHFPDDIFRCIFMNENACISNTSWLKFVPRDPIDNNTALVQIMAWRRTGDKPLSEPIMAKVNWRIYASLGLNELMVGTKETSGY